MKLAFACDHGGYVLKEILIAHYQNQYEVIDLGCSSNEPVDYPDYGYKLAKYCAQEQVYGIAICGSGIGINIACNKVSGIRAALVYNTKTAQLAKKHNNAHIICLGGRMQTPQVAINIIDTFLNATFESRHQGRLEKITKIEKEEYHG